MKRVKIFKRKMCGTKKRNLAENLVEKKAQCCWKRKKTATSLMRSQFSLTIFSLLSIPGEVLNTTGDHSRSSLLFVWGTKKKKHRSKSMKEFRSLFANIIDIWRECTRRLYCLHVVWVCNITLRVQQAVSLTQAQQWEGIALQKFNLVRASLQSLSFLPVFCAAKAGSHRGGGLLFTCVGVYKSISEDWEWHERRCLTEYKSTEIRRCRWHAREMFDK